MSHFTVKRPVKSGIALGGIGTGSVELWPDGEFHAWQIANQSLWGGQVDRHFGADDGEQYTEVLSFYLRCETEDGRVVVRKLGMRTDEKDFTYRMYAWNKPIERIDYDGRFPTCTLNYSDEKLPCSVSMKAISPFVPHQLDTSATPGFRMRFSLNNPEKKLVRISLIARLDPKFMSHGETENHLLNDGNRTAIHLKSPESFDDDQSGDICLSVTGNGATTWLTADYAKYLHEFVSHSDTGITQESFLFPFRVYGKLPDTTVGTRGASIPDELDKLDDETVGDLTEKYLQYPFARAFLSRMRFLNPNFPEKRLDYETILRYCARQIKDYGQRFGAAALGKTMTLKGGEEAQADFILTWNFPNHHARGGELIGHYYENLYSDAEASNRFLSGHPEIFNQAERFSELLYENSMPLCYAEALSAHLSTIVKNAWLTKDGSFGLWEGLGYCGFHTTDITYHDSFSLICLFPELQKKQMRMGADFQRTDGHVHHCFTPDLRHVDEGFDRVDMNPQFVLMACRDFLYTGDYAYLNDMYPHVISAMDSIVKLDGNDDGLPDIDTRRNTYDAWNFEGTSTYISILWLAALKAAALIAESLNDTERAQAWQEILNKGKNSLEKTLWNGSYYNLWAKDDVTDESLMTDQLDGEWFLRMMGISGNLSDERVCAVLKEVICHNLDPENGLVNATCLNPKHTGIFTYQNCQAEAVWTGIGYLFSALCLSVGLDESAENIVSQIDQNQTAFGLPWNHWECGPHYTRPMSSWTLLNATLRLALNTPEKKIKIDPVKNGTYPLILPMCIAKVQTDETTCTIRILDGSLEDFTISAENRKVVLL